MGVGDLGATLQTTYLRRQAAETLACADRAAAHWHAVQVEAWHQAFAIRLRDLGHRIRQDYAGAIAAYQQALTLWREINTESEDVALGLNDLAYAEQLSGNYTAAERDYTEALRIVREANSQVGVAIYTGNLADLALYREDWIIAERLAREALPLVLRTANMVPIVSLDIMRLTAFQQV